MGLEAFRVEGELSDLNAEALSSAIEQADERLEAFLALDNPSDEDVANAEETAQVLASLQEEQSNREQAAAGRVERMAALRAQRQEASEDETEDGTEEITEDEQEEEREEEQQRQEVRASGNRSRRRVPRPETPETPQARMTIIAAADTIHPTGSEIPGLSEVAKAWLAKSKGFTPPTGRGEMHRYPIASFAPEFPDELVASGANDQEVLYRAANESRLEGGSLTAAAGWCAPSETLYNVPGVDASTDGLVDVPEIQVSRGGFRYTEGIDFSAIYTDPNTSFTMTEAQAIAGTFTKPCYEIPCVDFTEVRLDATGLCVKVPILLEAGYPEVVRETISGIMIAQQHKESADMIARMVAKADAPIAVGDMGSVAVTSLDAVELVIQTLRSDYRLAMNSTMEVLAPFWLKSAIRADFAMRTGVDLVTVTDQQIEAHFAARGARVQWLYNWQNLVDGQEGYPATATLMVYPAGTFVKGVADVISLDAVYDAASLANNIYTGLFAERGILLAKMAKKAKQITIPVKAAGITGAASNTATFNLVV